MKEKKLESVLIIGNGPIIIGQAAEFDYAGTQACKAMREEGVRSILVNSNPATIMTDDGVADVTYIEPLTVEVLTRIIERERPDAILPTLGGQTGLNLGMELSEAGILKKYDVEMLGSSVETIRFAEDREAFKKLLEDLDEPAPLSRIVENWDDAILAKELVGLPAVIRPAYTLGGSGGGVATTDDEYATIVKSGLDASPINQILVEQSLLGWKELEYEVMRDGNDTCITICNMENLDPMGVHTGDSIVVAPSQTLTDREYQMLRNSAFKIIRALGIKGGCNVQFALAPRSLVEEGDHEVPRSLPPYYVIEVNPRVSRSSALASKATGYPIARVAAKIALGRNLHEIENAVTQRTTAAFEPALDYTVVKIPRWPFDKFATGDRQLGTQMKATGEVMAIARTFEEALQKAIRSLEVGGRSALWERTSWLDEPYLQATDERIWALLSALRHHLDSTELSARTGIDPWFLERLGRIVSMEKILLSSDLTPMLLREAKRLGFADVDIASLAGKLPEQIRNIRLDWDVRPVYKMVDTCAAEFDAVTPYFYSTYDDENEAVPDMNDRMLVLGSGPIRIGQGIEFDYCSVRAAQALRAAGVHAVMANSNPETVSTDFDTSDRLYFEPLDEEGIRDLLDNEANGDRAPASIVQFGGQTAINLAGPLHRAALPIAGSSAATIDLAEDRGLFGEMLNRLDIPQPPGTIVTDLEQALQAGDAVGYPVLVRPSYVLGGRAMEIVQNANEMVTFFAAALEAGADAGTNSVLIDKFLEGPEVEVDAVCDGEVVLIPGIMEHVERAGVHSGDSVAVYPPQSLTQPQIDSIVDYTTRMALELGVRGLMNVQFVIAEEADPHGTGVFIIEVNPRSSRTVPFISKVTNIPLVNLAVNIMLGKTLTEQGYSGGLYPSMNLIAIKAPVFSMNKLTNVDTFLGPEMKSTGEVMGIDKSFAPAMRKALIASSMNILPKTPFLLSISNQTKSEATSLIRYLHESGSPLFATEGTASLITALGIPVTIISKRLDDADKNVVELIKAGAVGAVINTLEGGRTEVRRDGFFIRRAATEMRIPCFTSLDTARVAVQAIDDDPAGSYSVLPISAYRSEDYD